MSRSIKQVSAAAADGWYLLQPYNIASLYKLFTDHTQTRVHNIEHRWRIYNNLLLYLNFN